MDLPLPVILATSDDGSGKVLGSIASLPASGSRQITFDLGPNWSFYTLVSIQINMGTSPSTTNTWYFYGSDAPGAKTRRLCAPFIGASNPLSSLTNLTTGAVGFMMVRPMGRYIVIDVSNTDATNAFGVASNIAFAAYPGA